MGYVIQYDPEKKTQYPMKRTQRVRVGRYFIAAAILCVTLLAAVKYRADILEWILPGDAEMTTAAFQSFKDDVREGTPAGEAITAFCNEIIAHATQ